MCGIDQRWAGELRPLRSVLWKARGISAPKETERYRWELKIPRKEVSPDKIAWRARRQLQIPFVIPRITRQTSEPWMEDFKRRLWSQWWRGSRGMKGCMVERWSSQTMLREFFWPNVFSSPPPQFFENMWKIIKGLFPNVTSCIPMMIPSVRGVDLGERSFQGHRMEKKTKTKQNWGAHLTSAQQTHRKYTHPYLSPLCTEPWIHPTTCHWLKAI